MLIRNAPPALRPPSPSSLTLPNSCCAGASGTAKTDKDEDRAIVCRADRGLAPCPSKLRRPVRWDHEGQVTTHHLTLHGSLIPVHIKLVVITAVVLIARAFSHGVLGFCVCSSSFCTIGLGFVCAFVGFAFAFCAFGLGFVPKMVYARGLVMVLCVVISLERSLVPVSGEARVLTREELAPLLAKKVIIPNIAKTPQATPWPEEFTIAFTTDDGLASGVLAYDWGNKQQAIVHGKGSSHCVARGSAGVCYILENPKGTYAIDPVSRKCELTNPLVGTVPPTWVVQGVFAGVEEVNGFQCNRFNYPPTMHAWLETVDGGLPCAFLFPNPSLTYYFDQSTLKLGKPALNIFKVPDYCPKDTYEEVRETSLRADQ